MLRKKILFVINSLGCGGAEKSLVSMLSAFDYGKYDVDLLMFRREGMFLKLLPAEVHILPELEFLKANNQTIVSQIRKPEYFYARIKASIGLRLNRKKRALHDAQCYWKYVDSAIDRLEQKYDAAIAWGQGNPTHYVAEKVYAKKKIAFINADYKAAGHNKEFDYPYYKKYDYIAAVSDRLHELVVDLFPDMEEKIVTIYDINNAELIQKMALIENPFENIDCETKIVTVGRMVSSKGYDLLTKCCQVLKKRDLDFAWFIVGDGPDRISVERDIEEYDIADCLFLSGEKDNPYAYMKNADIYVQTSRFEGYCLTLAEARILNIPVISTNFDVVYNQLHNEENGLIVEMDGEAIADAIMRLVSEERLRSHIIEKLKKEKKGNIEEIEKLYQLIEGYSI